MANKIISFVVLIIVLAIVAVAVSRRSGTAGFIQETGRVFGNLVSTVTSPIR